MKAMLRLRHYLCGIIIPHRSEPSELTTPGMRRELEPVFLANSPLAQEGLFLKLLGRTICRHEISLRGDASISLLKKRLRET
jgi:hypothetical protein